MPSRTEVLDNLYTTTWENRKSTIEEQVFTGSPFWFWMRDNGRLQPMEGGRFITEAVVFDKSDKTKFVDRGGQFALSDQEFMTDAIYEWRYLGDSIVRFGVEDQKNRGKAQIMSLVNNKLNNSRNSLVQKIEDVLFGDTTQTASDDADPFHGLQTIVPDNPAVGALGGIDPATDTFWRSKQVTGGAGFAANSDKRLRQLVNDVSRNLMMDKPDLIVSGELGQRLYEENLTTIHRINNDKLADAGFESVNFRGIPMVWSNSCSDTRMYVLNTNHLTFKYDPEMFFDMTEWKAIPAQANDRVAQIMTAGNLVTGRRKVHGVITAIAV